MNINKDAELLSVFNAQLIELSEEVDEIDDLLRAPDSNDSAERATENEDDEVLEERGKVAQQEIKQIEAAIARIKAGTYGDCATCGKKVGDARLSAVPYAPQCIDCATEAQTDTDS